MLWCCYHAPERCLPNKVDFTNDRVAFMNVFDVSFSFAFNHVTALVRLDSSLTLLFFVCFRSPCSNRQSSPEDVCSLSLYCCWSPKSQGAPLPKARFAVNVSVSWALLEDTTTTTAAATTTTTASTTQQQQQQHYHLTKNNNNTTTTTTTTS